MLAAGKGTRLFPLTGEVPKPMAPVVDTPIIHHIFDLLARNGVSKAHVNIHYLADALLEAYGEESRISGMEVSLVRERELTGTAGGVKHLAGVAAGGFDETFVIVSGDALTDVDIKSLVAFHKEKGALATIALHRVYDTSEFGVVELDEEGNILGFQEKPDPKEAISTLASAGVYVLEPEALSYIPENTFFDFANDVFPRLLEAGEKFVGYQGDFYWSDIGTLEAYRQAQYDVLSGKVRVKVPGEKSRRDPLDRGERTHPPVGGPGRVHRSGTGRGDRTRRHTLGGRNGRDGLLDPPERHHKTEHPSPRRIGGRRSLPGGLHRRPRLRRPARRDDKRRRPDAPPLIRLARLHQPVSETPDGLYEPGLIGPVAKLGAQTLDVDVDGALVYVLVLAPHLPE